MIVQTLPTEHPVVAGLRLVGPLAPAGVTRSYGNVYSAACSRGGDGQCDGYLPDSLQDCACSCHTDWDLPQTVLEVRDWHDEHHDVVRLQTEDQIYAWVQR